MCISNQSDAPETGLFMRVQRIIRMFLPEKTRGISVRVYLCMSVSLYGVSGVAVAEVAAVMKLHVNLHGQASSKVGSQPLKSYKG